MNIWNSVKELQSPLFLNSIKNRYLISAGQFGEGHGDQDQTPL